MDNVTIDRQQPEWTQDEAIAFEAARECIGNVISICTRLIADEYRKVSPDIAVIDAIRDRRRSLARQRQELRLKNHVTVARVRAEYGAEVRAFRARSQAIAAE